MPGIHFISMPETDSFSSSKISASVQRTYSKLGRIINNELDLKIQFKQCKESGRREKHTVRAHLSSPGITVVATEIDWELVKAVQKTLKTLEREALKNLEEKR